MTKKHLPFRGTVFQHEAVDRIQEKYKVDKSFIVRYLVSKAIDSFDAKDFRKAVMALEAGRSIDAWIK